MVSTDNKLTFDESVCEFENVVSHNKHLQSQNLRLVETLEKLKDQFGQSLVKSKNDEIGQRNDSTTAHGCLNGLLEEMKQLKEDNSRLCEELQTQLLLSRKAASADCKCKYSSEIKNIKTQLQSKIDVLKEFVELLQTQLNESQKTQFDNDCNYKRAQIETLEALKKCKLERDELLTQVKQLRTDTEMKKEESERLKLVINEKVDELDAFQQELFSRQLKVQELEDCRKVSENELSSFRTKFEDLKSENQCLMTVLEEIQSSSNVSAINKQCGNCSDYKLASEKLKNEIESFQSRFEILSIENGKLRDEYSNAMEMVEQLKKEKKSLEKDGKLSGQKLRDLEVKLKNKEKEHADVSHRLESCLQTLETKDKRLNELSVQLKRKTTEEKQMTNRLHKLAEKFGFMETEMAKCQQQLCDTFADNKRLILELGNQRKVSVDLKETNQILQLKVNELTIVKCDMDKRCSDLSDSLNKMTKEHSTTTDSLNERIGQLTDTVECHSIEQRKRNKLLQEYEDSIKSLENREAEVQKIHSEEIRKQQEQLDQQMESIIRLRSLNENQHRELELDREKRIRLERTVFDKESEIRSWENKYNSLQTELDRAQVQFESTRKQMEIFEKEVAIVDEMRLKMENYQTLRENYDLSVGKIKKLTVQLSKELEHSKQLSLENRNMFNELEKHKILTANYEQEKDRNQKETDKFTAKHKSEITDLSDKLRSFEEDNDKLRKTLSSIEDRHQSCSSLLDKQKAEVEFLHGELRLKNDEIHSIRTNSVQLQTEMDTLKQHWENSQRILFDRSRDVDRLEQVIRDRSEEMEERTVKLQEFEAALNDKIAAYELQLDSGKLRENELLEKLHQLEIVNENLQQADRIDKSNVEKLTGSVEIKQAEIDQKSAQIRTLTEHVELLKSQQNRLESDLAISKKALGDTVSLANSKENDLLSVSEKLEKLTSAVKAKDWKITQLEKERIRRQDDSLKIESDLRNQLQTLQNQIRKNDLSKSAMEKSISKKYDEICNRLNGECSELSKRFECVSNEKSELELLLYERQEQLSELKVELNTQKSVMVDLENNCRLKGTLIESLLKKLDGLTLLSVSERFRDDLAKAQPNAKCIADVSPYRTDKLIESDNR